MQYGCLIFILLIIIVGNAAAFNNEEYAYAVRFPDTYSSPTLVRINLESEKFTDVAKVPEMSSFMTIDGKGDVLIPQHIGIDTLGKTVEKYFAHNCKVKQIIKNRGDGPLWAIPYKDDIYVILYFSEDQPNQPPQHHSTSIEKYRLANGNYQFTEEIDLGEGTYFVPSSMDVDREHARLIIATSFLMPSVDKYSQILLSMVSLDTGKLVAQKRLRECAGVYAVAVANDDKVYIGATYKSCAKKDEGEVNLCDYLCVYDAGSLAFIKKVPVGPKLVRRLVYAPDEKKLYAGYDGTRLHRRPGLTVIDCRTDKVIKDIKFERFDRMEYVGKHKLLVTGRVAGETERFCLYVIDTQKDEIVRKVPGMYRLISKNLTDW